MYIVYSDEYERLTPDTRELMEQAADAALSGEFGEELDAEGLSPGDIRAELGVTVVTDEEIRALNRDYRGNDKVTDVLSFPQFEGHGELLADLIYSSEEGDSDENEADPEEAGWPGQVTLIGDVVICLDQAERQAAEYGTGIKREMLYLFVHSLMHLFGYDHMEKDEKKLMRAKEESVLSGIGITR